MPGAAARLVAIPAPVFYAVTFGAGIALDGATRWRLEGPLALRFAGWALLGIGLLIGPGSAIAFAVKGTALNPVGEPTQLVTSGAYRLSRNPMYLGLALAYVGLALVLGRIGPRLLLPLPLLFINALVIPFEEERLRSRFGDAFASYCARVRRWV